MENFKGLIPSEFFILENRDKFILLNESENEEDFSDITEELLTLHKSFKLGEMVNTEDFTLEETMNAVELNHFKMDSHYNYHEANTYRKLLREGKIKKIEDLNMEETLSLIDNIFIKEISWLNGSPIYQTIFNLVYFSDEHINAYKLDDSLFRIFLDSTLHLIYLIYSSVLECEILQLEDVLLIPIPNLKELERDKVFEELKNAEQDLKNKLKLVNDNIKEKKIYSALINRIKIRREFLQIIKEQFEIDKYENLISHVNTMKELLSNIKPEENNTDLTEFYFCDKLSRISVSFASIKIVTNTNFNESLQRFQVILDNLNSVSKIYELKDFYQILKSMEILNNEKPSFFIRSILEFNLFSKEPNLLFGKIDIQHLIQKNFSDFKINLSEDNKQLCANFGHVIIELLRKSLRNKSRQVRNVSLFKALTYMGLEGDQADKEIMKKSKTNKKSILTNFFTKLVLHEMIKHIWTSFELELFVGFELDYIFYVSQNIIEQLCQSNQILASSFAEKILKEQDFVKSNSKKKLGSIQKMVLDEIHILNGLRCALKGIALMCRYLKLAGVIVNPQPKEAEKKRCLNRFPAFEHCKFFIDFDYESFVSDTFFDVENEKEMIFHSADSFMKQAIKLLSELKSADIKLRDSFHYSNAYIDNLSKAIICNNLLLSKIKKGEKKGMKLSYTLKKYDTFLPILELN